MVEESEKNLPENTNNNDEFNRTIILDAPEHRKGKEPTPFHKLAKSFRKKKMEVGDLIGRRKKNGEASDTSPSLIRRQSALISSVCQSMVWPETVISLLSHPHCKWLPFPGNRPALCGIFFETRYRTGRTREIRSSARFP